jgi:hypothetical protein
MTGLSLAAGILTGAVLIGAPIGFVLAWWSNNSGPWNWRVLVGPWSYFAWLDDHPAGKKRDD